MRLGGENERIDHGNGWIADLNGLFFKSINQTINKSINKYAGVAQLAEHNPSKVRAAGSSPVSRS
ncbi:MAG: hypothetical protein H6Q21_337, partial [Bacteroidetes bacterium]|nr:hypothetical protein [Bacteroidota bacterium]